MKETLLIVPYGNTFVTLNLIETDNKGISSFRRIFIHQDHYTDLRHKLSWKRYLTSTKQRESKAGGNHLNKYLFGETNKDNILVYRLKASSKHKWMQPRIVKGDTKSLIAQVLQGSQRIFYGKLTNSTFKRYLP